MRFISLRIVFIVAACIILSSGAAAYLYKSAEHHFWPNLIPPASYFVDEKIPLAEQTIDVQIGGRVFRIPQAYIESKLPLRGKIEGSVLLEVFWPDMLSVHHLKDRAEYERMWRKEHRLGWILLEAAKDRPSLDQQTDSRRRGLTKEEYIGTSDGLDHYLWYHGMPNSPELWAEIYLNRRDGQVISRIECSRSASARFPGCSHKFIDGNLIYDISYDKSQFVLRR